MAVITRILPDERSRLITLVALLFVNALILESNEVVSTSGFVSKVGADNILLVWAADMLILILTSGAYSLVVDRTKREQLALALFVGFSLVYILLFFMFRFGVSDWVSYPLLTVVNDQQWILLPMLIWALASDIFSTAEAKRLFPLLGAAGFAGGICGNGLTALVARGLARSGQQGSVDLLVLNAGLLLMMTVILSLSLQKLKITTRQARQDEKVLDTLREGLAFVKEVPSYRYLTLAMVLLGIAFNIIEYQLLAAAARTYSETASLEAFYATMRAVRIVLMLVVQGGLAALLLKQVGFKSIFAILPTAMLGGLLVAFFWPGILGAVIGEYMAQITLQGIDEPSRRAFVSLVPDERRGRVSAFLDGYLYPIGSLLSCGVVGIILLLVRGNLLTAQVARMLYFGVAIVCAAGAFWAVTRFRVHYETSMLSWRLKRRQRKSLLEKLDFGS